MPEPKRIDQWTIADLERELEAIGAEISHCGQNRNLDHLGSLPPGYWGIILMQPAALKIKGGEPGWRYVTAHGKTISIAIARAIQNWKEDKPGKFGSSPSATTRGAPSERVTAKDGADLLKALGL